MNLVAQIEAALNGDALENIEVTTATEALALAEADLVSATDMLTAHQDEVTAATEAVNTANTILADAQAALQVVEDAGEDTTDAQAAVDAATQALATAEAVVVTETADIAGAELAVTEATTAVATANDALITAQGEASSADTLDLIASLKVTDYNMISNATMAKIMTAQGREVLFADPENVVSNSAMELVTPCTTDVTPVGK